MDWIQPTAYIPCRCIYSIVTFCHNDLENMVCSRTPPVSWLWIVPSLGARRKSFYYLRDHPIHGWVRFSAHSFMLTQHSGVWCTQVDFEYFSLHLVCALLCSPGGAERWAVQPRSWLVVAGNPAFLIGYWEGAKLFPVCLTWKADAAIVSLIHLSHKLRSRWKVFKLITSCLSVSSLCLQNQTTAVCWGGWGLFPMKCPSASAPHWPC